MQNFILFIQTILLLVILVVLLKDKRPERSTKKPTGKKLVMDTCALIDGRILEVVNAGFTPSQLIIPTFVVNELQMLADGQDAHKRERARFGLDVVKALQDSPHCSVSILKHEPEKHLATDDKLVLTAKKLNADLCTIDYNLNKVATIEGVRVLNINELANSVRPVALPGEKKRIKIVQKGSNKDQGVGYADDGSMIVVEGASKHIGKIVDVEVSRFIQTDAGKMLFARLIAEKNPSSGRTRARQS
jgi:uncharacterized protein YacL